VFKNRKSPRVILKHTTFAYIPNMKYLKPNSYLNWFEANTLLIILTQLKANLIIIYLGS
jgi:hypothetical protein